MTVSQLRELQTEFREFLQHGRHESRIAAQLRPPSSNDSGQRLDVYRNAYFIRLEKSLAHDFPVSARVLGPKAFARMAGEYVLAHPSRQPSIRYAGRDFSGWLRKNSGSAIGDLSAIEWAALQVVDGPDCVPARRISLKEIDPDDWARLYVFVTPTLSVLALKSNADRVWLSEPDGEKLKIAKPRWIAISRGPEFQPVLADLDRVTFAVLDALSSDPCLATVNEHLALDHDPEQLPEQVAKALHIAFANDWIAEARIKNLEAGAS